jgi:hypothetical protein
LLPGALDRISEVLAADPNIIVEIFLKDELIRPGHDRDRDDILPENEQGTQDAS